MIKSSIDTTLMIKPNSWQYVMAISSLIGLIIGAVCCYKKLSSMMKRMYWIAIIVLLVSSNLFPWKFIAKTPFKVIQFPWRLYLIPQVFLAYIVAWFLDQMIKKWRKSKGYYDNKGILLSIIIIVAVICGLQLSEQSTYISSIGNVRVPASTLMNTRDVTKDYYPKAALPEFKDILNHEAVAGKKHIKVTPEGHGEYLFKANRDLKRVQMPFVMYNGVKYRCEVNGRCVKSYRSKNGLLTVKNVKKGKTSVHTSVVSNIWESLFKWLLFIIGILWLIWQYFCYKYGDKIYMKFVKKHKEIIIYISSFIFILVVLSILLGKSWRNFIGTICGSLISLGGTFLIIKNSNDNILFKSNIAKQHANKIDIKNI